MAIEEYINKKSESNMYKNLKKLKGIEFQEKIKYEFALRDPLNIKAIKESLLFYENNIESFYELKKLLELYPYDNLNFSNKKLLEAYITISNMVEKINFFSFEITNIEEYKHPLIKKELLDIFDLLYFVNSKIDKHFIVENLNYKCDEKLELSKHIDKYDVNTFYLKSKKKIDNQNILNHYSITTENLYINLHDNKVLFEEMETNIDNYYDKTVLSISEDKKFKKNLRISLELNLGLPEKELINIIKSLSETYKEGNLSKNIAQKKRQTIFNEFKKVGIKYIKEANNFTLLLLMYDVISNKSEFGNPSIRVISEKLADKFKLKIKTLDNLRTAFKTSLNKQLYLQL